MKRSEKVYYDLNESTEVVELLETKFYFSSSFNKDRFLRGYQSYIKEEEDKLIAKYGLNISIRYYLLIAYYMKIEKRGFKVKYKGVELEKDYYIDCLVNQEYSERVKEWYYGS